MTRTLFYGCIVAIGLAGSARADEVEWRPVGSKKSDPIVPAAAQVPAFPMPSTIEPPTEPPAVMPGAPLIPQLIAPPPLTAPSLIDKSSAIFCMPMPCCGDPATPMPSTPIPFIANQIVAEPIAGACGCNDCTDSWCSTDDCGKRFWFRGEFLAWWVKSASAPPLLTTSQTPLPATDNNIGALGRTDTVLLLGGKQLDEQFRPGARFSAGGSFDPCGIRGFDGSVFFTGGRSVRYEANNLQFPQLFRPFFVANAGIPGIGNLPGEYREIVYSVPAGVVGRFVADSDSFFWGADVNARRNVLCNCNSKADAFMGFRYLHLDEELRVTEVARISQFNPAVGVPVGSTMTVRDQFKTDNDFYGGQVGLDYEYQRDKLSVGVRTSVALGSSQENVCVNGFQVVAITGAAPQAFNGGLLALNSNIGSHNENRFAVVPEATVRVGYQVTERVKVTAGYDFLYWSSVVRPGDQIDRVIDVNRVPNFRTGAPVATVHPAPLFNTTDFWAQGINVGAEYHW